MSLWPPTYARKVIGLLLEFASAIAFGLDVFVPADRQPVPFGWVAAAGVIVGTLALWSVLHDYEERIGFFEDDWSRLEADTQHTVRNLETLLREHQIWDPPNPELDGGYNQPIDATYRMTTEQHAATVRDYRVPERQVRNLYERLERRGEFVPAGWTYQRPRTWQDIDAIRRRLNAVVH